MQIEDLTKTRQIESEFNSMMSRMGHVFAGEPGFRTCQKYIQGLMGPAERKNGWQLSESQGAATPYEIQQFLEPVFNTRNAEREWRFFANQGVADDAYPCGTLEDTTQSGGKSAFPGSVERC